MYNNLHSHIKDIKDGNRSALIHVINMFNPIIQKYARFLNYEDAASELTEHLIECVDKIKLTSEPQEITYFAKCIKNKYVSLEKLKRQLPVPFEYIDDIECESFNNSCDMISIIESLPKRQRQIIIYRYYYGYSDQEIAKKLDMSRQGVCKARKKTLLYLKQILGVD